MLVGMRYKHMIADAKRLGLATEQKMWKSVDNVAALLERVKMNHPEEYEAFMRAEHENLFGKHYNERCAEEDVERLSYIDRDGKKRTGAHWTKQQVKEATAGKSFPSGVTECDKYVAFNSMYAALSPKFDDAAIIEAAYMVYFSDGDAEKAWNANHK